MGNVGLTAAQAEAAVGAGEVAVTCYARAADSPAQIAGMDAAQLIAPLGLALQRQFDADALTDTVFPHPMISEGINEAARAFRP